MGMLIQEDKLVGKSKTNKRQQQKQQNSDEKPPAVITETFRNVKYEYCLLKTVHSMEELDDFRFQHSCNFGNAKRYSNKFTRATLHCLKRSKLHGMCPFLLMLRRPHLESSDIHVYAYSEHNHHVKPEAERAANRVPRNALVPDADPLAKFTTPNGRQWTFLGTAKNQKKLERFRLKYHCKHRKEHGHTRISMICTTRKCQIHLLALKTERYRYHLYQHGQHICRYANEAGKKSIKARNDMEKPEEIQEEEEDQIDDAEELLAKMEEEGQKEELTAKNACPPTSSSGKHKKWPIERIQHRLIRALREGKADKVEKWMARMSPGRIGKMLAGMDIEQVVKLLRMARKAIRTKDEGRLNSWLGWLVAVLSFRGFDLLEIPDHIVDILLPRILRRFERRALLLPERKLRIFQEQMADMLECMQISDDADDSD